MNWSGASYLQNQSGLSELARQEREAAIKKKREDSLGYQIGHGVTGALKGAAGGALKGAVIGTILAPGVGTIAGATLGAGSGALSGSGVMSGAEQKSLAANAAQMAMSKGMGSYAAAKGPYGVSDIQEGIQSGAIKPEDLEMMRKNGQLYGMGGPAYMGY